MHMFWYMVLLLEILSKMIHVYNFNVYFGTLLAFKKSNVKFMIKNIVDIFDLNIVGYCYKNFGGKYMHSGVYLLSESHIAWHTFPEYGFINVSITTCGKRIKKSKLKKFLKNKEIGIQVCH